MSLGPNEYVLRRLAGHQIVEPVEEEHDGFSDVGRKDKEPCLGELK